jgi:hypothetical protein
LLISLSLSDEEEDEDDDEDEDEDEEDEDDANCCPSGSSLRILLISGFLLKRAMKSYILMNCS